MLLISQTIFYLVASIAIIAVGVLSGIVLYYLIGILRDTHDISQDINQTYHKAKRNIKKIINSFKFNKKYEEKNK